jgi:hypothetical protein
MKLIEALKQIKDLQRKAEDLRVKVQEHCAITSMETPTYGTAEEQRKKVAGWIQAHSDILKEVLRLRVAIQDTNLRTDVTIELNGKGVTKSIAAWIHRRRDLAHDEFSMWSLLTDKKIQEGVVQSPSGHPMEIKVVRFYDPEHRDNMRDLFSSEPSTIDAKLEIVNAITDLLE